MIDSFASILADKVSSVQTADRSQTFPDAKRDNAASGVIIKPPMASGIDATSGTFSDYIAQPGRSDA